MVTPKTGHMRYLVNKSCCAISMLRGQLFTGQAGAWSSNQVKELVFKLYYDFLRFVFIINF